MRDLGLADRIRAKGVEVVEVAGWQTRGSSTFSPRGSVNHHTAGSSRGVIPSLSVLINGRSDVPGPLCNVAQSREGGNGLQDKAYIIASGRANHAGKGGWLGLTGNSSVYGLEVEHVGNGYVPEGRLDVSARIHAAMIEGTNRNPSLVCQHFEWTTRKVDFSYLYPWTPGSFRSSVHFWIGKYYDPNPPPSLSALYPGQLGDSGMDGIWHDNLLHFFFVRDDGALIERWGTFDNPNNQAEIMPPGWCRPGPDARVKVIDPYLGGFEFGYAVAALRAQGDMCNVAIWNNSNWTLHGWAA